MENISAKKVWAQISFDLIGKDSYRGVSLTYSWLANQFGHFSLAFVTTFALYHVLLGFTCVAKPAFWAGIGIATAWFIFECYNFLGPLLLKKSEHATKNASGGYTFQPDWKNISYDTLTDVIFFTIGAFTMSLSLARNNALLYILIILVVIVIYPIRDWYLTKMYQQAAGYPFQFRLSQWNNTISNDQKQVITEFVNTDERGKHLLIFGANKAGKTSLSVAIANERSIKHHSCSYTTAMKLISLFYEANIDINAPKSLDLWAWRNASLLIIDDVNPGVKTTNSVIHPTAFLAFLNNPNFGSANVATIKNNSVIWVLGNGNSDDDISSIWISMLTQIGVDENKISCITL
jgi:hypothetical protein